MSYFYNITNNATTTLAQSITATGTGLVLTDASAFPAAQWNNGYVFYCTLTNTATLATNEIVLVKIRGGNQLIVERNQQGTVSPTLGWPSGTLVSVMPTKGNWEQFTQREEFTGNVSVPIGGIIYWPSTTAPVGVSGVTWALCDGTQRSTTTYAALYAVLGSTFGSAPSGFFKLPDLRGYFIRGANPNNSGGFDPNRVLGSVQYDDLLSHQHYVTNTLIQGYRQVGANTAENVNYPPAYTYFYNLENNGSIGNFGSETRPVNMALACYIRTT